MRAFDGYQEMDASFWAFLRYVSEASGYTDRKSQTVRSYPPEEIRALCQRDGIRAADREIQQAAEYSILRADLLNGFVQRMLMDGETARRRYEELETVHRDGRYLCKIPLNKQKGEKRHVAYFTAIVDILAEQTIRDVTGREDTLGFDDDPQRPLCFLDLERKIVGVSARRPDGAYPGIEDPRVVWEIKEYYSTKSFGSRVADGVYETLLDGFEFREIRARTGREICHVLFIDDYWTWWKMGRSYLCRLIDALNSGLVDEVIVGREVFDRWPLLLRSKIQTGSHLP